MTPTAVLSMIEIARLLQFVEQTDARLLLLNSAHKSEALPGQAAEIARLQNLRAAARELINQTKV